MITLGSYLRVGGSEKNIDDVVRAMIWDSRLRSKSFGVIMVSVRAFGNSRGLVIKSMGSKGSFWEILC
eukprot:1344663-Amorphochlora_amoeboformis.AAC.1